MTQMQTSEPLDWYLDYLDKEFLADDRPLPRAVQEADKIRNLLWKMYREGNTEPCFLCKGWGWNIVWDTDWNKTKIQGPCNYCHQTGLDSINHEYFECYEWIE